MRSGQGRAIGPVLGDRLVEQQPAGQPVRGLHPEEFAEASQNGNLLAGCEMLDERGVEGGAVENFADIRERLAAERLLGRLDQTAGHVACGAIWQLNPKVPRGSGPHAHRRV